MTGPQDKGLAVTPELRRYLLEHSIPRTDVHRRLVRATADALGDTSIMQIAEEQGPLLTLLARLVGARRAVEIGTFTGLSALCIAEGLDAGGRLTCFDLNDDWVSIGRPYWDEAGVADRIDVVIGPAEQTLPGHDLGGPVDFAFVDADKPGYPTYVDLLVDRMRPGGLIVVDNTLFMGAVLDEGADDANVVAIRSFNDAIASDDRVDAVLTNVGDGLTLLRVR